MNLKEKIVKWIRERIREAKAKGIVLGLSGGVDSSLVAVLAKEAVGEKLLGLILPCHSRQTELRDIKLIARRFKIKTKCIDLSEIYDRLIEILPGSNRLARANLKPRLRMLILYYFANKLNYLVVGTANKSERMVGYFTKHGDGAADILPIGDLLKAQVKDLAKNLGIPQKIIDKVPTANLWPGQTDEEELGISYKQLDGILTLMGGEQKGVPSQKRRMVERMIEASRHKREGPKIFYCKEPFEANIKGGQMKT